MSFRLHFVCASLCGVGQPADLFDSGASGSLPRETSLFSEGPLVVAPEKRGGQVWRERKNGLLNFLRAPGFLKNWFLTLQQCRLNTFLLVQVFSDVFTYLPQGRHLRRPGEEESDVDIEGFEEEDDGKPKTPAPVREMQIVFEF